MAQKCRLRSGRRGDISAKCFESRLISHWSSRTKDDSKESLQRCPMKDAGWLLEFWVIALSAVSGYES